MRRADEAAERLRRDHAGFDANGDPLRVGDYVAFGGLVRVLTGTTPEGELLLGNWDAKATEEAVAPRLVKRAYP